MAYNAFVKKETINVIIRSSSEKVEGEESFIPVIDAKVFCLVTGNVLFESEFLAVNKQHLILIADHLVAQ